MSPMPETVQVKLDGQNQTVPSESSVAAIIFSGGGKFRTSVTGEPRAALCGMGICFECRVTIDGRHDCRSCQIPVRNGMVITTT